MPPPYHGASFNLSNPIPVMSGPLSWSDAASIKHMFSTSWMLLLEVGQTLNLYGPVQSFDIIPENESQISVITLSLRWRRRLSFATALWDELSLSQLYREKSWKLASTKRIYALSQRHTKLPLQTYWQASRNSTFQLNWYWEKLFWANYCHNHFNVVIHLTA